MKVRFTEETFECLVRIEEAYPRNGQGIVGRIDKKTDLLVDNLDPLADE